MFRVVRPDRDTGGDGDDPLLTLDLSSVEYPSDNLSIRIFRQAHPHLFDIGFDGGGDAQPKFFIKPNPPDHAEPTVSAMLFWERILAANAYAEAAGIEGIETGFTHEDMTDFLTELYTRYGLATGPHHAEQLIRDFEQQAATLANHRAP